MLVPDPGTLHHDHSALATLHSRNLVTRSLSILSRGDGEGPGHDHHLPPLHVGHALSGRALGESR